MTRRTECFAMISDSASYFYNLADHGVGDSYTEIALKIYDLGTEAEQEAMFKINSEHIGWSLSAHRMEVWQTDWDGEYRDKEQE